MLLRYAVVPTMLHRHGPELRSLKFKFDPDNKLRRHELKRHDYTLRTLRAGFVHVYLGQSGKWQVYAVTSDGLLRLLADPDNPDQKTDREMSVVCKRQSHNLPSGFITVPPEHAQGTIWAAFSHNVWSREVRRARESAPEQRMQAINCAALTSLPGNYSHSLDLADTDTLSKMVEEYARDADDLMRRRWHTRYLSRGPNQEASKISGSLPSVHGFYGRPSQLEPLQELANRWVAREDWPGRSKRVAAFALYDPVGIVQEINHTRHLLAEWHQEYIGQLDVARPVLISQAIMGLKAIYEQSALLDVAREQGVKGDIAKLLKEESSGASKLREAARLEAGNRWARLENRYDETGRHLFMVDHTRTSELFQSNLKDCDEDYAKWAGDPEWVSWFDDFSATADDWIRAIEMGAAALSGGPMQADSYEVWKRWLVHEKPWDSTNPVYRAYFGGRKDIVKELLPDKVPEDFPSPTEVTSGKVESAARADKLYGLIKDLSGTDEAAKAVRALASSTALTAGLAHIQTAMQAAGAALAHELDRLRSATLLRAQQAGLHLYRNVQGVFITINTTLGEYMRAMREAGVSAAQASRAALEKLAQQPLSAVTPDGKQVRALVLAGMLNLSDPRVRDLAIKVTLWVADAGRSLLNHLNSVIGGEINRVLKGADVAMAGGRAAQSLVRVAGITLSNEAAAAAQKALQGMQLTAAQANNLTRKLLGSAVRLGGSKDLLLAAGSLYFQMWAYQDAYNQVQQKLGKDRAEALMSLTSAGLGVIAATAEIVGAGFKALAKEAVGKLFIKVGGGLAAVSTAVDSVQAFHAMRQAAAKGDRDAARLYFVGSGVLAGASIMGGYAVAIGAASLLGPLGIAILLAVVGVGLVIAATHATDSPAEIWLDRCFWGKGQRTEGKWSSREFATELAEMNCLVLGLKAEISFNDDWNELLKKQDTVNMEIMLPQYDKQGSALSLLVTAIDSNNNGYLLYRENINTPVPENLPAKVLDGSLLWQRSTSKDSIEHGVRVMKMQFLAGAHYKRVALQLKYWPDATDESALLEVKQLETD
ncbi:hypothetical protein M8A51_09230 [Schlegelella sp. S2-27]|uniref:Toxin VasX N-terminal region domain-containing protein n=1 Tax=Caldimonas mangrovi TaxID=2944811 RepID=A0ABT0YLV8_9BURK|nr:hypothetical protein [Caldimonas mangrovi]